MIKLSTLIKGLPVSTRFGSFSDISLLLTAFHSLTNLSKGNGAEQRSRVCWLLHQPSNVFIVSLETPLFFGPPSSFLAALSTMPSTFQDDLQHPPFCVDSFFCLTGSLFHGNFSQCIVDSSCFHHLLHDPLHYHSREYLIQWPLLEEDGKHINISFC